MPLHREYRPKNLDEFLGNEATVAALRTLIHPDRVNRQQTLLFAGPRGCGKTTLARIVASELGCSSFDFHEMNISNTRGIAHARELEAQMRFKPLSGDLKIYLLDEVQSATPDFQDSILKALEEPPNHVMFLLCTTEPEKLKKTVLSRCTKFYVQPLRAVDIRQFIKRVLQQEGVDDFPAEAIEKISQACEGIPREALVLLDKVIDITDETLLLEAIDREQIKVSSIRDIWLALSQKNTWSEVATILKALQGEDPESVRMNILGYVNKVLLGKNSLSERDAKAAALILECFRESVRYVGHAGLSLACYQVLTYE